MKTFLLKLLIVVATLANITWVYADSPARIEPYVVENRDYVFVMYPEYTDAKYEILKSEIIFLIREFEKYSREQNDIKAKIKALQIQTQIFKLKKKLKEYENTQDIEGRAAARWENDAKKRMSYFNENCNANEQKELPIYEKDRCKEIETLNHYRKSGMYRKGESNKSLWTVDWYSHQVLVANDGQHLIRLGPWASRTFEEAISFFRNGELLASYRINDLVSDENELPHSVSHFEWKKSSNFDEKSMTFNISTIDGNEFTFDVRTGQIEKGEKKSVFFLKPLLYSLLKEISIYRLIALSILIIFVFAGVLVGIKIRKRCKTSTIS